MKKLFRKLTRKRRLKRNLKKTIYYISSYGRYVGICDCIIFMENFAEISSIDRIELENLIYVSRPEKENDTGNYWWAKNLDGLNQRIDFLNKLISEL